VACSGRDHSIRGILNILITQDVNEDNYVPSTVKLRSRVDATMFTCELSAGALEQIETDPKVISVSPSKKIRMID
jgi:hypothetical protein